VDVHGGRLSAYSDLLLSYLQLCIIYYMNHEDHVGVFRAWWMVHAGGRAVDSVA
jgi:hypothetical protein